MRFALAETVKTERDSYLQGRFKTGKSDHSVNTVLEMASIKCIKLLFTVLTSLYFVSFSCWSRFINFEHPHPQHLRLAINSIPLLHSIWASRWPSNTTTISNMACHLNSRSWSPLYGAYRSFWCCLPPCLAFFPVQKTSRALSIVSVSFCLVKRFQNLSNIVTELSFHFILPFQQFSGLVALGLLLQFALHSLLYLTVSEAGPQIVQSELKNYLFHSRGRQEVHPSILEVQHSIQMLQQNVCLYYKLCNHLQTAG